MQIKDLLKKERKLAFFDANELISLSTKLRAFIHLLAFAVSWTSRTLIYEEAELVRWKVSVLSISSKEMKGNLRIKEKEKNDKRCSHKAL